MRSDIWCSPKILTMTGMCQEETAVRRQLDQLVQNWSQDPETVAQQRVKQVNLTDMRDIGTVVLDIYLINFTTMGQTL